MKKVKFILPVVAIVFAVAGVFATGNSAPTVAVPVTADHVAGANDCTEAENIDLTDNQLKLTANGARRPDGALQNNSPGPGRKGWYWSSSVNFSGGKYYGRFFGFTLTSTGDVISNFAYVSSDTPANGFACRCIKNE